MTSSRFALRKKAQPLPKLCTKPPIPEPPNTPIESFLAIAYLDAWPTPTEHVNQEWTFRFHRNGFTVPPYYDVYLHYNIDHIHIEAYNLPPNPRYRLELTYYKWIIPYLKATWWGDLPSQTNPAPPPYANPTYWPMNFHASLQLML